MKIFFLLLALAAPALFAQIYPVNGGTNDVPPAEVSTNGPQVTAIDGYAARVDDTVITFGEVRENAAPYIQQMQQQFQGKELARQIQQAFLDARESLIEEALLKEEVKLLGVSLPETFINEEVNRLIRERFNNDRALLTRGLAARRMTFEEWKQEVADQLTIRVFYGQEITRRASVPLQAVQDEYERTKEDYFRPLKVRYRLIVVGKGQTDKDRAFKKQQIEEVLQKLRDGADFTAVAEAISEGDTGESPWREVNDVREELRPALLKTPVGQISDLIETPGGFYIVKVEDRREEGYAPFDEVRAKIENRLLAIERDRLHRQLIERLAAKHFVERY